MFDDSALTDEYIAWKQKKKEQKPVKTAELKPESGPTSIWKGTFDNITDEYNAWKKQKQNGKKEVTIIQKKTEPDEALVPPTVFFLYKEGHKLPPTKSAIQPVTPVANAPAAPASAAVKVNSTKEPTIAPTKTPHRPPYIVPTVPTPTPAPTQKTPASANVSLEFDLDDSFLLSPNAPSKIERCVKTKTIPEFLKAVREEFDPLIPAGGIEQVWFHAMRHLAVQSLLIHAHKLTKQMQKKMIVSEWDRKRAEKGEKTFYDRLLDPASNLVIDKDTKWSDITDKVFLHERTATPQDEKRIATLVKQAERLDKNPHPQALITLARGFCDEDITLLSTAPAFLNLDSTKKKWEDYLENEAFFLSDSPQRL